MLRAGDAVRPGGVMPPIKLGGSVEAALTLTGEFELVITGRRFSIPHTAERVLAYLALVDRPVSRTRMAGTLWQDATGHRAAKNLRTALWNPHRAGADLVSTSDDRLRLSPNVAAQLTDLARTLICEPTAHALDKLPVLVQHTDLLPDWDEDWVIVDRERYRLLRLQALESAAQALRDQHRWGEALLAALAAAHSDPLRESARRLLGGLTQSTVGVRRPRIGTS
jgi:DNA-binding SARP family transcriptional activator